MKNTVILIVGPTAVGKTSLAIKVAQHFSTKIISCDSRQCFKELNIGVAKPSPEELNTVTHYFINSHSCFDTVNAAVFEQYALDRSAEIFRENNRCVMVGGTGLYAKAFCDGIDAVPEIDAAIRKEIIEQYNTYGIEWLQQQIKHNDELYLQSGEMQNPQRMMRALEVKLSTGTSILDFHSGEKKIRNFDILKIGLELPREILIQRINERVDVMMQDGLQKEVESLMLNRNLNALQTVGYKELFSFFEGNSTLAEAVEMIKVNTRQYAKRQMTWFKKDAAIEWLAPDYEKVLDVITKKLSAH